MVKNLNKIIAFGLLLFLFSGLYLFSLNYDPLQTEDEDIEVAKSSVDKEFEELFGISSVEEIEDAVEKNLDYRLETFELKDGWGYKIYVDQKIIIDQGHIPAISDVLTFFNQEQAEKTGKLVLKKIKDGIFPPSISITELDSLGVDY
jgi:hypothetical protein